MTLAHALSRTLLLMRTDLVTDVDDTALLGALTAETVVVGAGADALATHSGQSALIMTALTLVRSGHQVWIDCDDAALLDRQPPLVGDRLHQALRDAGADLLPGCEIRIGRPQQAGHAIMLGDRRAQSADRVIACNATNWSARLGPEAEGWSGGEWPVGAIAIAALVAAEVFKSAMRRLAGHARDRAYFRELYAPCTRIALDLAPPSTPLTRVLPEFDMISGGAIANAVFAVLARIPMVSGTGRVFDDDHSALSNLNRNALLRRSAVKRLKVDDLAALAAPLELEAMPVRFGADMALGSAVLVGVDDIPSRWAAQAAAPDWLGVGATEGFAVQVSAHRPGDACCGCLHPEASPPETGPIPTSAFVSLLSGVLLVGSWQRQLGTPGGHGGSQLFLNALRPESWACASMPVSPAPNCPVGCAAFSANPSRAA